MSDELHPPTALTTGKVSLQKRAGGSRSLFGCSGKKNPFLYR